MIEWTVIVTAEICFQLPFILFNLLNRYFVCCVLNSIYYIVKKFFFTNMIV